MKLSKHIDIIVMSLLRELRAFHGYNIPYFRDIKFILVNFLANDNLTLKKTTPIKTEKYKNKNFSHFFLQKSDKIL